MMKKALLFALVLAFALNAAALKVGTLDISVNVDSSGNALVAENYSMAFSSPFEENAFEESARNNSSSLLAWQADFNFFFPHFGNIAGNEIETSTIIYDPQLKAITLRYSLKGVFAQLVQSEQRADSFLIQDRQLSAFRDAGIIVIPENTKLRIILPPNSEIDASKLPERAVINENQVLFTGIQSNSMSVAYKVTKPIAPIGSDLFGNISGIYLALIPLAAIALIVAYAKRDEIEEKIEGYLVEHSEIKKREPDEELDLDI